MQHALFHTQAEDSLKQWHTPYAELFRGCKQVLDVGCAQGYFLDLLKARDVASVGLDIAPQMVAATRARAHQALLGDERTIGQFDAEFDGVHISHVVEHLWGNEAVELLENCTHALKSGGLLVVRTPNWCNRAVRRESFWLDHTHKRPYPLRLLHKILSDLQLRVLVGGYEPFGLEDIYVICRKPGVDGSVLPIAPIQWQMRSRRIVLRQWFYASWRRWAGL